MATKFTLRPKLNIIVNYNMIMVCHVNNADFEQSVIFNQCWKIAEMISIVHTLIDGTCLIGVVLATERISFNIR